MSIAKAGAMPSSSSSRALVHHLLASHLAVDDSAIRGADHLVDLGIYPLDLVLVVLRLEDLGGGERDVPLCSLDRAGTVDDLVVLVDLWLQHPTASIVAVEGRGRRSSAA
jgi:hypothetical protein